jgi:hypothetical protein
MIPSIAATGTGNHIKTALFFALSTRKRQISSRGARTMLDARFLWTRGRDPLVVFPLFRVSTPVSRLGNADLSVGILGTCLIPNTKVRERLPREICALVYQKAQIWRAFFDGLYVESVRVALQSVRGYIRGLNKGKASAPPRPEAAPRPIQLDEPFAANVQNEFLIASENLHDGRDRWG